jgi:hypothetical protein
LVDADRRRLTRVRAMRCLATRFTPSRSPAPGTNFVSDAEVVVRCLACHQSTHSSSTRTTPSAGTNFVSDAEVVIRSLSLSTIQACPVLKQHPFRRNQLRIRRGGGSPVLPGTARQSPPTWRWWDGERCQETDPSAGDAQPRNKIHPLTFSRTRHELRIRRGGGSAVLPRVRVRVRDPALLRAHDCRK